MRIAMVAPVWERIPPAKYGGIELVVYLLTEELVKRGHQVTLFASGDSITSAKLASVYPVAQRAASGHPAPDLLHVATAYQQSQDFDLIHNHAGYSGVALANFISTPVLTTLHGIFTNLNKPFFRAFKDVVYYNSISEEQRRNLPELNYAGNVYNAIDVSSFPFSKSKSDYYVLISRVSKLKGTHRAIEVAKKAGVNLVLAGKIDPGADTAYFEEEVHPHLDGKQIIFLGEVSEEKKRELLKNAKAFIFPLDWPEPFGLVMIEAMACGTPVVAFPYGAVPEVVANGKTGFLVKTQAEMVKAIKKVDQIDLQACRQYVEERFSVHRMADDYENFYEKILKKASRK